MKNPKKLSLIYSKAIKRISDIVGEECSGVFSLGGIDRSWRIETRSGDVVMRGDDGSNFESVVRRMIAWLAIQTLMLD